MLQYLAAAATVVAIGESETSKIGQVSDVPVKKRNFRWIWTVLAAFLFFGATAYASIEGYLIGRHILSGISVSFVLTLLIAVLTRKKNED